jgi:hypothetical protein
MPRRTRKLIGAVVILVFVCVYALAAMSVAQGRIQDTSRAVQAVFYLIVGLAWILPLMPLLKWMERPDPEEG